jgi:arabinofuranosyltransferase
VLLLSCVCFGCALFWLRRSVGGGFAFAISGLLLVGSNAAFDYTSSGQENVLGYALMLCALSQCLELAAAGGGALRALKTLFGASGFMLLCRHDLALLVAPLLLWAAWSTRNLIDRRTGLVLGALFVLPLTAWSVFSILYYGSPFPNPAYAKLSAGFPRSVHLSFGLQYLLVLARRDVLSIVCVVAALGVLAWQRTAASAAWACAILLHTLYVVCVGGDYMQGRFVSYEIVLGCALVARQAPALLEGSARIALPLALVMYALSYERTPLNTAFAQPKPTAQAQGPNYVMDARATLGVYTSLHSYLHARDLNNYPEHPLAIEGRRFAHAAEPITVVQAAGMFGWAAGTKKIIIEAHGIADPLLARLPASTLRGVGHYARYRPEGYIAGLASGNAQLEDPDLNQYYKKLTLITQSPVWSWQRLKTIALFNLGAFDPLLDHFVHEKIHGKQQWPQP